MGVWVLETGEDHEGGRIISIHKTKKSAMIDAYEFIKCRDYSDWLLENDEPEGNVWFHDDGCDWLSIEYWKFTNHDD